jgi:hypothetical protein
MIKVIKFKKLKTGAKKYEITFNKNGKVYTRKFGASGASDYTKHKDKDRRERYITRHKKDLKTNDPMRPGYLSMYILWNKPTVAASLADYKRRLNSFNRNGKFPKGITGSKKLNSRFGALVEFQTENSYLDKLPDDVQDLIQREVSTSKLQKSIRSREWPSKLLKEFLDHVKRHYIEPERRSSLYRSGSALYNLDQWFDDYKKEPRVATEKYHTRPGFMGNWFRRLAKLPSASFFKRQKSSIDITSMVGEYLSKLRLATEYDDSPLDIHDVDVEDIASSLIAILIKSRFPISRIPPGVLEEISDYLPNIPEGSFWREAHIYWSTNWPSQNSFGKSSGAPSNVVNKKLYMSVKAKIKRSIKGRRWGAYDSGRLVREYKAKGGKYSGGKGKTDLGRWYKEKWVDACAWPKRKPCGRKTPAKIAYCRPSKRVDSKTPKLVQTLSKTQRKSRCTKKKRSPLKRVNLTKFGQTTQDEGVPYGDGSWVIHCSYHPWGAHSTLRYKPVSVRPNDYSYHYGIHNDGTLRLWATGWARDRPIPQFLYLLLVNYYNTRCIDISKTTQTKQNFYISDQYGTNTKFGYTIESAQNHMLHSLLSGNDPEKNLHDTITRICRSNFTAESCQKLFTYFILNLYHTFDLKIPGGAPRGFIPVYLDYDPMYNKNLKVLLYLLQDHSFGTFHNARLASRLYEILSIRG